MQLLSSDMEKEIKETIIQVVEQTLTSHLERHETNHRYMRPDEAAKYCGVSKQSLSKWVYEFGLKQVKIGQVISYDRKDLDDFMMQYKI